MEVEYIEHLCVGGLTEKANRQLEELIILNGHQQLYGVVLRSSYLDIQNSLIVFYNIC